MAIMSDTKLWTYMRLGVVVSQQEPDEVIRTIKSKPWQRRGFNERG
jgi:hypothetical protein